MTPKSDNFYDLLGLELNADVSKVRARLDERIRETRDRRNAASHIGEKRAEMDTLLAKLEAFKKRSVDDEKLREVMDEQKAEKRKREQDRFDKLQENIRKIRHLHSGRVSQVQLDRLFKDFPDIPSEKIRNLAADDEKKTRGEKLIEEVPPVILKKIVELQNKLSSAPKNLYEFLKVADPKALTASDLSTKAEAVMSASTSGKDNESRITTQLAGQAKTNVFNSEARRAGYDAELRRARMDWFRDDLKIALHDGQLSEIGVQYLLDEMGKEGFQKDEVMAWLEKQAAQEGFTIIRPPEPTRWEKLYARCDRWLVELWEKHLSALLNWMFDDPRVDALMAGLAARRIGLLQIALALFSTSLCLLQFASRQHPHNQYTYIDPELVRNRSYWQEMEENGWDFISPSTWPDLIKLAILQPQKFVATNRNPEITQGQVVCFRFGRPMMLGALAILVMTGACSGLHLLRRYWRTKKWLAFVNESCAYRWSKDLTEVQEKNDALKKLPSAPGHFYLHENHPWFTGWQNCRQVTTDRRLDRQRLLATIYDSLAAVQKMGLANTIFGRAQLISVDANGHAKKIPGAHVYTADHLVLQSGEISLSERKEAWLHSPRVTFAIGILKDGQEKISIFGTAQSKRPILAVLGSTMYEVFLAALCGLPFVGLVVGLRSAWKLYVKSHYNAQRCEPDDHRMLDISRTDTSSSGYSRSSDMVESSENFYRKAFTSAQTNMVEFLTASPIK